MLTPSLTLESWFHVNDSLAMSEVAEMIGTDEEGEGMKRFLRSRLFGDHFKAESDGNHILRHASQ